MLLIHWMSWLCLYGQDKHWVMHVFPYIKWMVLKTRIWKFESLGIKLVFVLNIISILCLRGNIFFSVMSTYYLSTRSQTSLGSQFLTVSSLFFNWCSDLVIKTVLFMFGVFFHVVHANSNIHNILWYIFVIYSCFVFSFKLRYKIWFIFQLELLLCWIFLIKVLCSSWSILLTVLNRFCKI